MDKVNSSSDQKRCRGRAKGSVGLKSVLRRIQSPSLVAPTGGAGHLRPRGDADGFVIPRTARYSTKQHHDRSSWWSAWKESGV